MKTWLFQLVRLAVTLSIAAVAIFVGWSLWVHYEEEPWTRDGRVRASVVAIAPDVSGLIREVLVQDNQAVKKGDVLFRIDQARFELAVRQAEAVLAERAASLDAARKDFDRYHAMSAVAVSQQKLEQVDSIRDQAEAAYQQAEADRDLAKLNLRRTEVRALVNGVIANFDLRPGSYVTAGQGVAALVDQDTLRVEGYFEETKLPLIRIGDKATVHLMGESTNITGHVEGIAGGIEDRERNPGANLLANINPTFSWVRLAQRIPVRVALDEVPADIRLVAGRTASVVILPSANQQPASISSK